MQTFYPLLAELGVLVAIALLYYLIQRYRIIRNDKFEIKQIIEECAEQIHQYVEENPSTPNKDALESYADKIVSCFRNQEYKALANALRMPPREIPDELRYDSENLYEKIMFHAK